MTDCPRLQQGSKEALPDTANTDKSNVYAALLEHEAVRVNT